MRGCAFFGRWSFVPADRDGIFMAEFGGHLFQGVFHLVPVFRLGKILIRLVGEFRQVKFCFRGGHSALPPRSANSPLYCVPKSRDKRSISRVVESFGELREKILASRSEGVQCFRFPRVQEEFPSERISKEVSVMSATSVGTIVKKSVGWSIGLSILMILAGCLAIAVPQPAGIAVNLLVAWLLVFSGAAHLVFAWHTRTAGGVLWELLLGVLYISFGVYLLFR